MGELKPLEFAVFGDALNTLLIATGNKLSREWPTRYRNVTGACALFVIHLRIAHMTYRSALYLAGDKPEDPRRLPEFCVSLPLLNRSLLDSLFTILFILEDIPKRCAWFFESDWKELRLDLERYTSAYSSLPEWQPYLHEWSRLCDFGLKHANLTPTQIAAPKTLRSWPNPGSMATFGVSPSGPLSPVQAFMTYLNDFFYVDLSQQAHLGGSGMSKRGAFFIDEIRSLPTTDGQMKKYRYAQIGQAVALSLALVSEIESHFDFGLRERVLFVWNSTVPVIVVANEMYEKRYRSLLC